MVGFDGAGARMRALCPVAASFKLAIVPALAVVRAVPGGRRIESALSQAFQARQLRRRETGLSGSLRFRSGTAPGMPDDRCERHAIPPRTAPGRGPGIGDHRMSIG